MTDNEQAVGAFGFPLKVDTSARKPEKRAPRQQDYPPTWSPPPTPTAEDPPPPAEEPQVQADSRLSETPVSDERPPAEGLPDTRVAGERVAGNGLSDDRLPGYRVASDRMTDETLGKILGGELIRIEGIEDARDRALAAGDAADDAELIAKKARQIRRGAIADLLRAGYRPTPIARTLGVSVSTVKVVQAQLPPQEPNES